MEGDRGSVWVRVMTYPTDNSSTHTLLHVTVTEAYDRGEQIPDVRSPCLLAMAPNICDLEF
jgi:hypothetical protein